MIGKGVYCILYGLVRAAMFLWHPVFRVYGRENVPEEGALLICPNHSGMADPIWTVFALRPKTMLRIMAKKEAMDVPVLGKVLNWLGVFGVDRSGTDVKAIKIGLKCLKSGQRLMIFPEGTRVKKGCRVPTKGGAVMLAYRTGVPILPVYLSPRKHPFCQITCVIGEPVIPQFATDRPREEEFLAEAERIMNHTYQLGAE